MPRDVAPLRVLTWQVHGNYMYYLSQVPCEWYLVTRPGVPGYAPPGEGFDWGANVSAIAARDVAQTTFDCVLYQSRAHWENDRRSVLTPAQRALPCIYLEHDPPQRHPTNTRHCAAAAADLLVHVTPFNALMWDNGAAAVRIIEHAAVLPETVRYSGTHPQGIAVINHLLRRGRRLGADVYLDLQSRVPLRLIGMGAEQLPGGIGEIAHRELPRFMAEYRYLFNPIRWTSLGLSVVEAMTLGMPVVGLATTELVRVIENGRNGWLDTDPRALAEVMRELSHDRALARRWGEAARETARARFAIERFVRDWSETLATAMHTHR